MELLMNECQLWCQRLNVANFIDKSANRNFSDMECVITNVKIATQCNGPFMVHPLAIIAEAVQHTSHEPLDVTGMSIHEYW